MEGYDCKIVLRSVKVEPHGECCVLFHLLWHSVCVGLGKAEADTVWTSSSKSSNKEVNNVIHDMLLLTYLIQVLFQDDGSIE